VSPAGGNINDRSTTMSIFGNIMSKIFHHGAAAAAPAPAPEAAPTVAPTAAAPAAAAPAAPAAVPQNVDVGAVLSEMASMKGGGGNYQSSIVDLLKLLDLDSSLASRKELANELNVHAGEDGSAEENIALHKAVMDKLAENGGVVPDSLRN
jgi:3-oxoacyl-ACP reductase-like protein